MRKILLAKIHIAKKELGLSDGDYRAFVQSRTGYDSCRDCTDEQLTFVLEGMRELGFNDPTPQRRNYKPIQRKVIALWRDLGKRGAIAYPTISNLNRWIRRQYRVDRLEWLDDRQVQRAIEALKDWVDRTDNTGGTDDNCD